MRGRRPVGPSILAPPSRRHQKHLHVEPIGGFHLPACQAWLRGWLPWFLLGGKDSKNATTKCRCEDLKFHQIRMVSENGNQRNGKDTFLLDP